SDEHHEPDPNDHEYLLRPATPRRAPRRPGDPCGAVDLDGRWTRQAPFGEGPIQRVRGDLSREGSIADHVEHVAHVLHPPPIPEPFEPHAERETRHVREQ